MLSSWIEDAYGHAIRVFDGSDQTDSCNHAVQVINGISSVRIRTAADTHPDELNWAKGDENPEGKVWCDRMARSFGYTVL